MTGRLNSGWTYRERIDGKSAGMTVLDYYSQRYRHSTREEWRDRLENEQIWLDNQLATADTRLKVGQQLTYHRLPWYEPEVPLNFEVLYEDDSLLVVAKPSGLPVMPAGGFLEHTLLHQLQQRYPQDTPVPIHRLGRGTSGLVLLARSPQARSHLTAQLRHRQMGKVYRTLAQGHTPWNQLTIERAIGKIPHPVLGYLFAATPEGAFARSDCQVLQRRGDAMLVEVRILTGRPHQIRIHLAAAGFPLVGDPLYAVGGVPQSDMDAVPSDLGYLLHAYSLAFRHPVTEKSMQVICPPPPPLQESNTTPSSDACDTLW